MANWLLTFTARDAYQRKTTKKIDLVVADLAAAQARTVTLLDAFATLMDAKVLKYSLAQETTYSDALEPGANIDVGVTISCDLGGGKTAALKIPSFDVTAINPDGSLDLTDARVTALQTEYLSGEPRISDGEIVLGFLSGKLDQ